MRDSVCNLLDMHDDLEIVEEIVKDHYQKWQREQELAQWREQDIEAWSFAIFEARQHKFRNR